MVFEAGTPLSSSVRSFLSIIDFLDALCQQFLDTTVCFIDISISSTVSSMRFSLSSFVSVGDACFCSLLYCRFIGGPNLDGHSSAGLQWTACIMELEGQCISQSKVSMPQGTAARELRVERNV